MKKILETVGYFLVGLPFMAVIIITSIAATVGMAWLVGEFGPFFEVVKVTFFWIGMLGAGVIIAYQTAEIGKKVVDKLTGVHHLPACGTMYRGCAPSCPVRLKEEKEE